MNETSLLDLSSLKKALDSLNEAIMAFKEQRNNLFIRDASIQRFEYTYELSYKMLKRFLEMTEANPAEIDQMSFPTIIRTGAERGLLKNSWDKWTYFRTARNLTSHTYNEAKAIEVCEIIPDFFDEASFLYEQLNKRSAK